MIASRIENIKLSFEVGQSKCKHMNSPIYKLFYMTASLVVLKIVIHKIQSIDTLYKNLKRIRLFK